MEQPDTNEVQEQQQEQQQEQVQEQVQQEQVQQEQVQQEQQVRHVQLVQDVQLQEVHEVQLKKYRAAKYDNDDQTYAMQMKRYCIPPAFNEFTDGLMDETHINRFGLLQAIDDYNKTEDSKIFRLEAPFQDAAFNFRPYQPCCIS
jgi:hypothetical protein